MTTDEFSVMVKDPGADDWSVWMTVSYMPMAEDIALRLEAERPTSQITIRKRCPKCGNAIGIADPRSWACQDCWDALDSFTRGAQIVKEQTGWDWSGLRA